MVWLSHAVAEGVSGRLRRRCGSAALPAAGSLWLGRRCVRWLTAPPARANRDQAQAQGWRRTIGWVMIFCTLDAMADAGAVRGGGGPDAPADAQGGQSGRSPERGEPDVAPGLSALAHRVFRISQGWRLTLACPRGATSTSTIAPASEPASLLAKQEARRALTR